MLYKALIRPLLFQCDPEWVHHQTLWMGETLQIMPWGERLLARFQPPSDSRLTQTLWGYSFTNPLGLAAGFDKNIRLSRLIETLGFGFTEVGSISAQSWPGNPQPRLFRLPQDKAIINRMGLNNHGVSALLPRIRKLSSDWPVGISLVKTPDPKILGEAALADFAATLKAVYGSGTYLSINISCPNTEEGKTFEDPDALDTLLKHLRAVEAECQEQTSLPSRPWCLKISPDLSTQQLQEMVDVAQQYHIAGWVACNTSASRSNLKTPPDRIRQIGAGGLSGPPIQQRSTQVLGELYQLYQGQFDVVLIGVGGIHDVESAWQKITHGASLLQLYTGLIYEGPGLLKRIQAGLLQKLDAHGFASLQDAVGSAFR